MKGRPTFYYLGKKDLELRAGGLIFYKINKDNHEPEFLMIKCCGKYEDFGGKTDSQDNSIIDTVSREAEEESNGIFKKKRVKGLIKNRPGSYCKHSKYIVYVCKAKRDYDPAEFGEKEYHDNIERTVEWIPYTDLVSDDFIKNYLHTRLRFKYFFSRINNIFDSVCGKE